MVLVSPMRRALHTCHIIFENHPSHPKVIVEPAFREILESSNDIGSSLPESMLKYPHFDFTQIKDPHAWYVDTLNPQDKERVL